MYEDLVFNGIREIGVLDEFTIKYESVLKNVILGWQRGDQFTFEMWNKIPEIYRMVIVKEIMKSPDLLKQLIKI